MTRTVRALVSRAGRYLGAAAPFGVASPWWPDVEPVTAHLDEALGVPTAVLRLLQAGGAGGRGGTVTYLVEAWGDPLDVLDPTPPPDWPRVLAPQPHRAAWAAPGGPQALVDWAVAALGGPPSGRPVQVKSWNLSCLYRLPTDGGPVWAKQTGPFMVDDSVAIGLVARHDPALVPGVVAADSERGISLLRHAPGVDCYETDAATIEAVVARWVAVQAGAADDALGDLPVRPPSELAPRLGALVERRLDRRLAGEAAAAHRLVAALPDLVVTLESAGLPSTLVHGDFHPGNWRSDGRAHAIVDWGDSYVGHPAADVQRLMNWVPPEQGAVAARTWIDAWRAHRPGSHPERALAPMAVLVHVLGALLYQGFLDNIEPDEHVYHEDDPVNEVRAALSRLAAAGCD